MHQRGNTKKGAFNAYQMSQACHAMHIGRSTLNSCTSSCSCQLAGNAWKLGVAAAPTQTCSAVANEAG